MFELFDRLVRRIRETKLPDVQARIKRENTPSMDLIPSTWTGEEDWLKFLILNDGTVIPVEESHAEAIHGEPWDENDENFDPNDAAVAIIEFSDSGGIQGKIDRSTHEMNLDYEKALNSAQILSLKSLYIKYNVTSLVSDYGAGLYLKIKSADQLAAVLQYGKEMAVAPSERIHFDLFDRLIKIREGLSVVQRELKLDLEQGELENSRGVGRTKKGGRSF
jgi:hypothetical protein